MRIVFSLALLKVTKWLLWEAEQTLSIGERRGEFPGMLEERTFHIIKISKAGTSQPLTIRYVGDPVEVNLQHL